MLVAIATAPASQLIELSTPWYTWAVPAVINVLALFAVSMISYCWAKRDSKQSARLREESIVRAARGEIELAARNLLEVQGLVLGTLDVWERHKKSVAEEALKRNESPERRQGFEIQQVGHEAVKSLPGYVLRRINVGDLLEVMQEDNARQCVQEAFAGLDELYQMRDYFLYVDVKEHSLHAWPRRLKQFIQKSWQMSVERLPRALRALGGASIK